ncbi:MAG: hypothetical protein QM426_12020 [Euryarchaeota archaeon]|nr:hypothetical protein [Euryarchaeota archaeon]
MNSRRYLSIENKKRIFFHIGLLLVVLFASVNTAVADLDPDKVKNPQVPVQILGPVSDYGLDMDGDGLYDYLVVKFNAQSNVSSNYYFTGDLSVDLGFNESNGSRTHEFRMLNHATNSTYLDEKTSTVTLNFEGGRIRKNELNGPYKVQISLSNESWSFGRGVEHSTGAYEYVKFEQPEFLLSGPVRSKDRAIELAEKNAFEAGIDPGELKAIEISSEINGEIWVFTYEQNGTRECFAVEGNTVEDIRHWTLDNPASKSTPSTPFLNIGSTIALFALACLFAVKPSAKTTSKRACTCKIKIQRRKDN